MLRVLMVVEDYGELMFLQTVLKKIGFDVDAIQNPRSFGDSILRMNPDILMMTAHGKRVKGVELSQKIRRVRGLPRIILLRQSGSSMEPEAVADGWLESPVGTTNMLFMIADLSGLNRQVLSDKYAKIHMQEIEEEKARVMKHRAEGPSMARGEIQGDETSHLQPSSMPLVERQERYKKFLEEHPPEGQLFSLKDVQDQVRALRKTENSADLEDLERERKAFVEHLFNKTKAE